MGRTKIKSFIKRSFLSCNANINRLDNGQSGLSLTLMNKKVGEILVTPKVGALFQHFNASVTKKNLTLHRYPLPKHQ